MLLKVQPHELYQYSEVYRITRMQDGSVRDTEPTGFFVRAPLTARVGERFLLASASSCLLKSSTSVEINVRDLEEFQA